MLTKGSFLTGALTMLAFALGTLPALLSLSAVSSFAKGAFQKHFVRLAGAAVIVLGILNIQFGLVLTGQDIGASRAAEIDTTKAPDTTDTVQEAVFDGTTQRITMQIVGLDYRPNQFIVKPGVPVQWWIDASQADGCGRVLVSRGLRIQKLLSATSTTMLSFTLDRPGEYAFNCGMGMMTPNSKIIVQPKDKG